MCACDVSTDAAQEIMVLLLTANGCTNDPLLLFSTKNFFEYFSLAVFHKRSWTLGINTFVWIELNCRQNTPHKGQFSHKYSNGPNYPSGRSSKVLEQIEALERQLWWYLLHTLNTKYTVWLSISVVFLVCCCSNIDSNALIAEQLGSNYMATTPVWTLIDMATVCNIYLVINSP